MSELLPCHAKSCRPWYTKKNAQKNEIEVSITTKIATMADRMEENTPDPAESTPAVPSARAPSARAAGLCPRCLNDSGRSDDGSSLSSMSQSAAAVARCATAAGLKP